MAHTLLVNSHQPHRWWHDTLVVLLLSSLPRPSSYFTSATLLHTQTHIIHPFQEFHYRFYVYGHLVHLLWMMGTHLFTNASHDQPHLHFLFLSLSLPRVRALSLPRELSPRRNADHLTPTGAIGMRVKFMKLSHHQTRRHAAAGGKWWSCRSFNRGTERWVNSRFLANRKCDYNRQGKWNRDWSTLIWSGIIVTLFEVQENRVRIP